MKFINSFQFVEHYTEVVTYREQDGDTRTVREELKLCVGEWNTKPSMTIPDQTLSMKDLVDKYIRGEHVEVFQGTYSDEDFSEFDTMDKMEKLEYARQVGEVIQEIQYNANKPKPKPVPPAPPAPDSDMNES